MATLGAGLCPCGNAPYGYGTPDVAPILGGSIFRDPLTGETLSGRRIDPATGDYAHDDYGRVLGMTQGQQVVYLAMKTELGSSAMLELGNDLLAIKVIGDDFTKRVQEKVRVALQRSVSAGLISRVRTVVEKPKGSRAFATIRWFDETTKQEEKLTL